MKCWLGSGGRRVGRSSWPRTCVGGTRTSTDASPSVRARLADSKAPGSSEGARVLVMKMRWRVLSASASARSSGLSMPMISGGRLQPTRTSRARVTRITTEIDRNAHDHDLGSHDLFHGDGFTSEAPQSDELRRLSRECLLGERPMPGLHRPDDPCAEAPCCSPTRLSPPQTRPPKARARQEERATCLPVPSTAMS